MKRFGALTGLVIAAASALASAAQAGDAGTPHPPDLVTQPPTDIRIELDQTAGRKLLRLTNVIANYGQGPLELRPEHDPVTHVTTAYQRLYTHSAEGTWSLQSEFPVGTFEYHPSHGHWHLDGFALYELRGISLDGSIGRRVMRSSGKVSFCLVDTLSLNGGLEHSAPATYRTCSQDAVQGISVGWGDVYASHLPGQTIDITGLPNGTYWLTSTADPDNRLTETNDANNRAAVKLTIHGNRVLLHRGK